MGLVRTMYSLINRPTTSYIIKVDMPYKLKVVYCTQINNL